MASVIIFDVIDELALSDQFAINGDTAVLVNTLVGVAYFL